jgi:hypothetical protein
LSKYLPSFLSSFSLKKHIHTYSHLRSCWRNYLNIPISSSTSIDWKGENFFSMYFCLYIRNGSSWLLKINIEDDTICSHFWVFEHPYHHLSLLRKRLVGETKDDGDRNGAISWSTT